MASAAEAALRSSSAKTTLVSAVPAAAEIVLESAAFCSAKTFRLVPSACRKSLAASKPALPSFIHSKKLYIHIQSPFSIHLAIYRFTEENYI
jgi:hypothetical protein